MATVAISFRKYLVKTIRMSLLLLFLFLLTSCSTYNNADINVDEGSQVLDLDGKNIDERGYLSNNKEDRYVTQPSVQIAKPMYETSPEQSAAINKYRSVLKNDAVFVNVAKQADQTNLLLSQLLDWMSQGMSESYPDTVVEITEFAIIDLDGDGIVEVILRSCAYNDEFTNDTFGFLILHYQGETVYQYGISYRGFRNLKIDGSFDFSSGAANSGYGTIQFDSDGYTICRIAESRIRFDENRNSSIAYFVDGEETTESEYSSAMHSYSCRANAPWYAFTEENINNLIGN